jgi:hypothetical protein
MIKFYSECDQNVTIIVVSYYMIFGDIKRDGGTIKSSKVAMCCK